MYRFSKYVLILLMVFFASFALPSKSNAQPIDPGCDPLDPACPIDGGVSLLIAAAIGIGAKKAYNQKKKDTVEI